MDTWKTALIVIGALILAALIFNVISNKADVSLSNSSCFIDNGTRQYIGLSTKTCSQIRYVCSEGMRAFSNVCGCGCEPIPITEDAKMFPTYCTNESRNSEACTLQYHPVCGWFDPGKVKCIKAPCAIEAPNACEACKDPNVLYYTNSSCPT